MNILVSTRLKASPYEERVAQEAVEGLAGLYPNSAVYEDRSIDWDGWRAQHGGHDAAYKFAGQTFDMFVFIEGVNDTGQFLARGQWSIATEALLAGKQVFVWRAFTLYPIRRLRELPQEDWAARFAEVVI